MSVRVAAELFDVTGRRILVTGAASGLGRAMAEVTADGGASVTLIDRDADGLAQVAAELTARGRKVRQAAVDITDAEQLGVVFADAQSSDGGVDVVFANAGISAGRSYADPQWRLEAFPWESWRRAVAVNLDGALTTMRAAAEIMRRQGSGKIVVTASTAGLRSDPMVGYPYVATKAALINTVKQAALDLAPYGVTVNAIAPGPFRTNIGGAGDPDAEVEQAWARTVPLGRMGDPEELKGLALLLASDASSFMTGAVYAADGGALATSHTA